MAHHICFPQNTKDEYYQGDTLDFVINHENLMIKPRSFRVCGDVVLERTDGGAQADTDKVYINSFVGAHSFIDQVLTETRNFGLLATESYYGRYVNMKLRTNTQKDSLISSKYVPQLITPDDAISGALLKGVKLRRNDGTEIKTHDRDFCIEPEFILNSSSPDINGYLQFSKFGEIKITLRLANNARALFGDDAPNYQYVLKNVKMTYSTFPDDGQARQIVLRHFHSYKQSFNSKNATIASKVPAVAESCVLSFVSQEQELSTNRDSLELQKPTDIKSLTFLFNDAENYITYPITAPAEILRRGIEALNPTFTSSQCDITQTIAEANKSYVAGLRFSRPIDLSRNKFTVDFDTEISSDAPYVAYLFFEGIKQL